LLVFFQIYFKYISPTLYQKYIIIFSKGVKIKYILNIFIKNIFLHYTGRGSRYTLYNPLSGAGTMLRERGLLLPSPIIAKRREKDLLLPIGESTKSIIYDTK